MNDTNIEIIRTPQIIAAEISQLKEQTRKIVINNAIEIGRRLCEAKEMVDHGAWGNWLKVEVDYSQATAENLMKIYREYGSAQGQLWGASAKSQTFESLSYSQALALLAMPAEEREEFVETNNVSEMSTRELQQAIKDRDAAKATLETYKMENDDLRRGVDAAQEQLEEAQKNLKQNQDELKKEIADLKTKLEKTKGKLHAAKQLPKEDALVEKKLMQELKETKEKLWDTQMNLQKAKAAAAAAPAVTDIKIDTAAHDKAILAKHVEIITADFNTMLKDLLGMEPVRRNQYMQAAKILCSKMDKTVDRVKAGLNPGSESPAGESAGA